MRGYLSITIIAFPFQVEWFLLGWNVDLASFLPMPISPDEEARVIHNLNENIENQ